MSNREAIDQFKLMGIFREEDRQRLRFTFGDVIENQSAVRVETMTSTHSIPLKTTEENPSA